MNEHRAEKLYNGVTQVGDDLIAEAGVVQLPKRKKTASWRWGAIAACLCLALVGTGVAAQIASWAPPRLEANIDGSGRFDGYLVKDKLAAYPLDQFSDAFLEAGETNPKGMVMREFSTFDEVRAYLGEGIPCSWPENWNGGYRVQLYHNEQQKIWGFDVVSEPQDGRVSIWMHALTKNNKQTETEEQCHGLYGGGPDAEMEQLDSYQMPNGCVAESFTIKRTEVEGWDFSTCISFFIKDGNLYEVSAHGELDDPARLWPEVQAVLDRFP